MKDTLLLIKKILKSKKFSIRNLRMLYDLFNLEYYFKKSNINFNIKFQNSYSNSNIIIIGKKDIDFLMKYLHLLNYKKIPNKYHNYSIVIDKELSQKPYINYFLMYILPKGKNVISFDNISKVKRNGKNILFLRNTLKISNLKKILRNDKLNIQMMWNFISNANYLVNLKIDKVNYWNTLKEISNGVNIARFGDGEMSLINGNAAYQKHNKLLSKDLISSMKHFSKKNRIAINDKITTYDKNNLINERELFLLSGVKSDVLNQINIKKCYSANLWSIPPYYWFNKTSSSLEFENIIVENKSYNVMNCSLYKTEEGKKYLNYYNKRVPY